MKLTAILLTVVSLQLNATGLAQSLTLQLDDVPLQQVFREIRKQTGYVFFYENSLVERAGRATVRVRRASLEETLDRTLAGHSLQYTIVGRTIVIRAKEPAPPAAEAARVPLPPIRVTGTVVDSTGKPLEGASVRIKGSTQGVSADASGNFQIEVPDKGAVLEISFVGYQSVEQPVTAAGHLRVVLKAKEDKSDDVVVVGFGRQKKVSVVGAIQSVNVDDLKIPVSNLSNAFAGKLSGVIAFQRSGQPGADGASFYIRGISTFSGMTSPLIILDGVAVSAGDLNALAPEVIESFSILKDATATAVYGSRGANGVMIVTTKRGRNIDKPRINVRVENAVSLPTSVPRFVGGTRFMELYNEAVSGRSTGEIPYSTEKIEGTRAGLDPYLFPNVNWYGELFKNYALNQSANVNVMGGGQKVDYFMSATFNHDNGILKKFDVNTYDNNISVKRYAFQNNLHADLTPGTKVALRLNAQVRDYHGPAVDASTIFGYVMEANPVDFPIMFPMEEGSKSIRFGGKTGGRLNDGYLNPFAEMVRGYSDNFQSTVVATVDGEQKLDFLARGLTLKALGSFKNWSATNTSRSRGYNQFYVDSYTKDPDGTYRYDLTRQGVVQSEVLGTSNGTTGDRSIYFQTSLDYSRSFGAHSVSGLLLYNQQEFNINAPGDFISALPKRTQGVAGRMTYGFANKYLAEFNFGYNGSENFAKGHRFGFFPSAALGYVVSNEDYWQPFSRVISNLKLRGSWGLVGNDQIGGNRFVYMSDINLTGQGYTTGVDMNYGRSGPVYNRFENPDITWEVAEKINAGVDLQLFSKVNLVADVFREHRTGIFLQRNVTPESFGTDGTAIYANLGEVVNKGFDLSLDYQHRFSRHFQLELKGTVTFAHNEVKYNDEPPFYRYKNLSLVGHPINSLLGYQADRLYIDDAEVQHGPKPQLGGFAGAGDIKYKDITNGIDGLNMINSDDRTYMGYPTIPELVYGFGPSLKYKKLDVSFFFQGVGRTSFFINGFHPFGTTNIRNVLQFIDDNRWSPDHPDIFAAYPRLSKLDNPHNTANSSFWLRDGSFLKLRNAEVGYSYKFARVYLRGYNLATFSRFRLWDPEQGGGNGLGYPTQRVFNFGVQMGF